MAGASAPPSPAFVNAPVGPLPALTLTVSGEVRPSPAISRAQRADLLSKPLRNWSVGGDDEVWVWLHAYVVCDPDPRRVPFNPAMPMMRGDAVVELTWEDESSSGVIDLTPHTPWALLVVDAWARWHAADVAATRAAFAGRGTCYTLTVDDLASAGADAVLEMRKELRAIALPPELVRV